MNPSLKGRRIAVVLFNLGGPDDQASVKPFLFNLFNDPAIIGLPGVVRTPLARLISSRREKSAQANYALMGGGSPLLPETRRQAEALQAALGARLDKIVASLKAGLDSGGFVTQPAALFELRIALSEIVFEAVALELQAGGGRCYLDGPGTGFARRWREAAFVPIITPSTVQLRTILDAAGKAA